MRRQPGGSTLPGLRIPLGSSTRFTSRMSSTASGDLAMCMYSALATPMPCSALMLPWWEAGAMRVRAVRGRLPVGEARTDEVEDHGLDALQGRPSLLGPNVEVNVPVADVAVPNHLNVGPVLVELAGVLDEAVEVLQRHRHVVLVRHVACGAVSGSVRDPDPTMPSLAAPERASADDAPSRIIHSLDRWPRSCASVPSRTHSCSIALPRKDSSLSMSCSWLLPLVSISM